MSTTTAVRSGRSVTVYTSLARIIRTLRSETGSGSLSLGSTSALWVLVTNPPMRLSELSAHEGVSAPTMSRIVSSLERDGMVRRVADPADGRASLIEPTEDGIELIDGTTSARARLVEDALNRLEPGDRAAAQRSIELLAAALTSSRS
ncbi:MarR family winged helix-turn-helix transcriptional regulator [Williamsia deligens]|uniref:MarR family winged helix-turn-helix transcriptional regulator n=1 Tax=Williamsia deligens TaxID=321325 RepID=A0ABW3G614_9NOCA|nr:MarR family transcriptional regulator [Williamsia deligens]MCP2193686.1 DNA-binding transcriptional regulator, MarR family [Williamsia deligens]